MAVMATKGSICQWALLLLWVWPVRNRLYADYAQGCICPKATVLTRFPAQLPSGPCCLNFSGSTLGRLLWPTFGNETNLQVLDLSRCDISHIEAGPAGASPTALRALYLSHNKLTALPGGFLSSQPSLRELDLSMNQLAELPGTFLRGCEDLQELDLRGNRLRSLPGALLRRPGLQRLELADNPWDCSCTLVELLQAGEQGNTSLQAAAQGNSSGSLQEGNQGNSSGSLQDGDQGTTRLQNLLGNITCASPAWLSGKSVWSVRANNVCRPPGLTALFILLPLLILLALVLCWCCGRKRKRKETPAFGSSKKKAYRPDCNGHRQPRSKLAAAGEVAEAVEPGGMEVVLKNQLLLRPSSTLLGSTRDIYEEVEIKLGSVESLPRAPSHCSSSTEGGIGRQGSRGATEGPEASGKGELDAVSVTEVMKDSADREKAYLTQTTEYYSLVPGIELEDSDHGEYESVDLS